MLNFLRTPKRLDSMSSHIKAFFIFCMCLTVTFAIHTCFQVFPIFGNTKTSQADPIVKMTSISSVHEDTQYSSTTLEKCSALDPQETLEFSETLEAIELSEDLLYESTSPIPSCLYLHLENSSKFSWVPVALEEKISENDILVDLSFAIDHNGTYELSSHDLHLVNLAVQYEAGGESFLGQLLVAEDILGRIRSGIYGPDVSAILVQGYEAERDENGNLHFCYGSKEILGASSSVQQAVQLALNGSRVSYHLLKAVTALRNEQYDLQLDDTYYKWGAMYHYRPEDVGIGSRSLNRVPVSFQYSNHIFYGFWLPKSAQLNL